MQSGEKSWAVHKAVICSRSGFFDGACSHPFKESASGIIDLSEDDPEAVEHMIHCTHEGHSHKRSAETNRGRQTSTTWTT